MLKRRASAQGAAFAGVSTIFGFGCGCYASGYDERLSHTIVIQAHYVYLLETLEVKYSGLLGELFSRDVVSAAEKDEIGAEVRSFRVNEKFLSVLSRKSSQQFQLFLSALDKCGLRHVRIKITETQGLSILFLQRGAVKRLICLFVCLLFTLMSKWLKLPAKGLVTHNGITIIHICEMLTEPLSSGVSNTCKVKNFINFHQYIFMKSSDYIA